MRSQLPENVLVNLLRQCYTTPRCQLRTRSQYRRLHALRSCYRLPRSSSSAQRREFQTHNGGKEHVESTERQLVLRTKRSLAPGSGGEHIAVLGDSIKGSSGADYLTTARTPIYDPNRPVDGSHTAEPGEEGSASTPRNIAILGGGITGLSAAHYLTRELPTAKITIYDSSNRLGGWLQSKRVDVGNGNVLFESGPRTLRTSIVGMTTVELIQHLNLKDEIIVTPKSSVAARNRFVYYPDHLVKMPSQGQGLYSVLWNLITEPVFAGLATSIMEASRPQRATWSQYNNPEADDESVASFLERRTGGPDIGNNLASAVIHGIYAGDINQLSARSLMPKFWYDEAVHGSCSGAMVKRFQEHSITETYDDTIIHNEMQSKISQPMKDLLKDASVYSFKQGIETLAKALEKYLRANRNVQFKTGYAVKEVIDDAESKTISVTTTKNMPPLKYDKVISTIFAKSISKIAKLPTLESIHAVTVMVVNLYYTDPDILPVHGFGYLIPRSISFEQNPECALGVVFDSDATAGQDTVKGTKVTVMLGGHWWDGMDSYPDEEEGAAMAKSILLRHLNISKQPEKVIASLQRNCIPQYTVGHEGRMKAAHKELMIKYDGRLTVAGNSYTGVGVNDCVRAARDVVMLIKHGYDGSGLEEFAVPKKWTKVKFTPNSRLV